MGAGGNYRHPKTLALILLLSLDEVSQFFGADLGEFAAGPGQLQLQS